MMDLQLTPTDLRNQPEEVKNSRLGHKGHALRGTPRQPETLLGPPRAIGHSLCGLMSHN